MICELRRNGTVDQKVLICVVGRKNKMSGYIAVYLFHAPNARDPSTRMHVPMPVPMPQYAM